jgi:hypothetical protein
MEFIKARRKDRSDAANGRRVESLKERYEKALQNLAVQEGRREKHEASLEKVKDDVKKAEDRVAKLRAKIYDLEQGEAGGEAEAEAEAG